MNKKINQNISAYTSKNHFKVVNSIRISDYLIEFPINKNFVYIQQLEGNGNFYHVDIRYLPMSVVSRAVNVTLVPSTATYAFCEYTDKTLIIYAIYVNGYMINTQPKAVTHRVYSCVNSLLKAV